MWVKGMSLKFFQEKKLPTQDKKTEQKVAVWYSDNNTLKYTAQLLWNHAKGDRTIGTKYNCMGTLFKISNFYNHNKLIPIYIVGLS